MRIGIVVHGPNIIDSGYALKLIDLLKNYGNISVRLGGTMGRTAVIDASLENIIDITRKLVPSDSLKIFSDEGVDLIFLLNYGKSNVTGQVFGYKVYNHYADKVTENNVPVIQIERPGEEDGSIIPWNNDLDIVHDLSKKLNLAIVYPNEVYENHIKQDNANVNQRIVHGVSPDENIMVNSVVIGKTNSDKLTLIARDNHIVDIIGGELKQHGLEKLGEVDLDSAIVKTGLLRHAKVTPRVISTNKSNDYKITFLDHAGEDVYKFRDSSLVITVGDDTTLISSDILYRFDIPVIGITDGDLDKVVEDGFKVKNSIIFEVERGFDDVVGRDIKRIMFDGAQESFNYLNIEEVRDKIIEIINNINCKYKISYIE
ncbi:MULTISPECIES: DUF2117 domain-containing protein [Methanobrevibacter]|uniref:DUF2117 domain-containing protein n=1 Tax=Methanobrevibacter gottschalkii DSM 11977 TaxID=1122229 RepID=A0A3N5B3B6_9EURY|nr:MULTISPECIES: DUF2117 domain-containing protein [Methanobrevibacter]OEC96849.1 hypothetical protein A9505_06400 [Methanobrevibacter sp. A27]RPF51569.1 hypothetical protein EDC42_0899 [Methanobrevibacter gottschalkii DSM 11977]